MERERETERETLTERWRERETDRETLTAGSTQVDSTKSER